VLTEGQWLVVSATTTTESNEWLVYWFIAFRISEATSEGER
jgi:hypothetical protein